MDMFKALQLLGPMAGGAGAGWGSSRRAPLGAGARPAGRRAPLAEPQPTSGSPAFQEAFAGPMPREDGAFRDSGYMDAPPVAIANAGPLAPNMGRIDAELAGMPGPGPMKRGPLAGVGDFVKSDTGKGALFRASAALLDGGSIGDGMMAGAGYVDAKKAGDKADARYDKEFGLRERGVDIQDRSATVEGLYKSGQLELGRKDREIDLMQLSEAIRKNQAGEVLNAAELAALERHRAAQIAATVRGQDVSAATAMRGQDKSLEGTMYSADSGRATADANRAYQYGGVQERTIRDAEGNEVGSEKRYRPDYGEIRYDSAGNPYYMDALTGRPMPAKLSPNSRPGQR